MIPSRFSSGLVWRHNGRGVQVAITPAGRYAIQKVPASRSYALLFRGGMIAPKSRFITALKQLAERHHLEGEK